MLPAPFALSPIMQRFALPGLAGIVIFVIGVWQDLFWVMVAGAVLAAPVLWAYAVLLLVYLPILIYEAIRSRL
jgi:hypothetical protein